MMSSGQDMAFKEQICLYSKELRMPSLIEYGETAREALAQQWGYERFLLRILEKESHHRKENTRRRKVKTAGFPLPKTLDTFEFERLERVEEPLVWELASGDFITKRENIILIGNPGTGKTHLAIGLGMRLCERGFSVIFTKASDLVIKLTEAQDSHTLSKLHRKLEKVDLLILDELSYMSFSRNEAEHLFHVLASRNERGSVLITTNLEFSKWTDLFPDKMLTAALIDRLTHHSHILDMNGRSYRLQEQLRKRKKA